MVRGGRVDSVRDRVFMSERSTAARDSQGLVFNVQRYSIHDGPGIRTTVFLKGCPLRCWWCCNPEALHPYPEIITRDVKCIRSGHCADVCPQHAIALDGGGRRIDWARCDQCTRCAAVCRARAIEVTGTYMSVVQVIEAAGKDASYYRRSGGGITLSGGEPLLQWEFALETLKQARSRGWHTALDTTGHADWEAIEVLLPHTHLVLYDLKHTDAARHRNATGKGNERILENLQKIVARGGVKVWVRRTVVPQFNDDEEEIEELARYVRTLGAAVEKLSLLPYHTFGAAKYTALGRPAPAPGIPPGNEEQIRLCRERIERHGIRVDVGR
ncbi:MAG: glycyl-radical enzyme activator family protein [Deltaproteobacteria bacterium]|nr:glycyl-radical enzyme activator family protein [Deltaproteobacteria bacterium]